MLYREMAQDIIDRNVKQFSELLFPSYYSSPMIISAVMKPVVDLLPELTPGGFTWYIERDLPRDSYVCVFRVED